MPGHIVPHYACGPEWPAMNDGWCWSRLAAVGRGWPRADVANRSKPQQKRSQDLPHGTSLGPRLVPVGHGHARTEPQMSGHTAPQTQIASRKLSIKARNLRLSTRMARHLRLPKDANGWPH
jgi:hypothetical protein